MKHEVEHHMTRDGRKIPLSELTDEHLDRIIKLIERKAKEGLVVQYGFGMEDMWYDEEMIFGDAVRERMGLRKYLAEEQLRKEAIDKHQEMISDEMALTTVTIIKRQIEPNYEIERHGVKYSEVYFETFDGLLYKTARNANETPFECRLRFLRFWRFERKTNDGKVFVLKHQIKWIYRAKSVVEYDAFGKVVARGKTASYKMED